MAEVHLLPQELAQVLDILQAHLPAGARVRAFGSRATGRGLKPHSDLDLLIDALEELPLAVIGTLREAFSESDLSFFVDLLQPSDAGADFLAGIERSGMVELLSPTMVE